MAPDLINREVDEILEDNPGADREAVEERVRDRREGRINNHEPKVDWMNNPDTIDE